VYLYGERELIYRYIDSSFSEKGFAKTRVRHGDDECSGFVRRLIGKMERRTEKGKEKTLRACERVNIKIKGVC
jgi:hypothetical protein